MPSKKNSSTFNACYVGSKLPYLSVLMHIGVTFEMANTAWIQNMGYNIHFYGDIQRIFGCPAR